MNKVILIGNVGSEPQIRQARDNKVASFSLATSEHYNGETTTQWHSIVAWRNVAELAEKYIHTGSKLMIEGKIQYRDYTDRDGNKRNVTDIIAVNFEFLSPKVTDDNDLPA